jgi:hypothetical protein
MLPLLPSRLPAGRLGVYSEIIKCRKVKNFGQKCTFLSWTGEKYFLVGSFDANPKKLCSNDPRNGNILFLKECEVNEMGLTFSG